jgi:arylsulfatase A-like enzyme
VFEERRMHRRNLARLLLVLSFLALLGVVAFFLAREQIRRAVGPIAERVVLSRLPEVDDGVRSRFPNILLVSVDTWRASELGFYEPSLATTPHLDRRRKQFVRFDRAISQAPWTAPAHLALFYSRLPPVAHWEWDVLSLTQILGHYGYATAAFTDGGWLGRGGGIDAGFDRLESPEGKDQQQMPLGQKLDQVTSWLEEGAQQPFFLFVHTYHTHASYDPDPEYLRPFHQGGYQGRFTGDIRQLLEVNRSRLSGETPDVAAPDAEYVRALYRAEIREVDEFLEQLFRDLEARGLWEDLLVVVTSDHGESFLERGFFEHGTGLYDELLRVPLLIKLPLASVAPPRTVTAQVELLDLPPTILDLIGAAAPAELEGRSFLSLLAGQTSAPYDKRYARSAVAEIPHYGDAKQSVRTDEWKYIFHPASGREELYRLTGDPEELHDVSEAHPDVVESLGEFLQDPDRIEALESLTTPHLGPEDREILRALGYIE